MIVNKKKIKTFIIGISGKKQSGKSTLCYFLEELFAETDNSLKSYSFNGSLKQKICKDVLGLTEEQVNGSDEQKNSFTLYKWDNLPLQIRYNNKLGYEYASNGEICKHILPTGFITAREILQIVDTDIFRNYFSDNIWVDATLRNIEKNKLDLAFISNVRFPSEVENIINSGGCILRLLRNPCNEDFYNRETALDNYDFESLKDKVCIINNIDMTIEEKNKIAWDYIAKIWELVVWEQFLNKNEKK